MKQSHLDWRLKGVTLEDQIVTLITDMFSFRRVRYTSLHDLAEDIWLIMKTRVAMVQEKLTAEAH